MLLLVLLVLQYGVMMWHCKEAVSLAQPRRTLAGPGRINFLYTLKKFLSRTITVMLSVQ